MQFGAFYHTGHKREAVLKYKLNCEEQTCRRIKRRSQMWNKLREILQCKNKPAYSQSNAFSLCSLESTAIATILCDATTAMVNIAEFVARNLYHALVNDVK